MIRSIALSVCIAGGLTAQSVAPGESGSIRGMVMNGASGQPLSAVEISVRGAGTRLSVATDDQGRYEFQDILPGQYIVEIAFSRNHPFSGKRTVNLGPGQDLRSVDLRLYPNQSVSGRIVDDNGEPLPGVEVVLLGREYYLGELRYYRAMANRTNDRGEYRIERGVPPGTGWLLWAMALNRNMEAVSDAPQDPKLRRQATVPTYHPNASTAEEAALLTLRAGEQKEGVDIRMARSPSLCLEAQVDVPGQPDQVTFWIHDVQPPFRLGADGGTTGIPSGGRVGPGGKLRVCGLRPGITGSRLSPATGTLLTHWEQLS
jgi:hypothetical protein